MYIFEEQGPTNLKNCIIKSQIKFASEKKNSFHFFLFVEKVDQNLTFEHYLERNIHLLDNIKIYFFTFFHNSCFLLTFTINFDSIFLTLFHDKFSFIFLTFLGDNF